MWMITSNTWESNSEKNKELVSAFIYLFFLGGIRILQNFVSDVFNFCKFFQLTFLPRALLTCTPSSLPKSPTPLVLGGVDIRPHWRPVQRCVQLRPILSTRFLNELGVLQTARQFSAETHESGERAEHTGKDVGLEETDSTLPSLFHSHTAHSLAATTRDSPCARSEKRPANEVSFRVPGNICFFALMGRKHDAEVEFTCCHSQKSAKGGFSKGFLSDRSNRTWSRRRYLSRPAGESPLGRWNNGDFVQNNAFGRGVMTKTERSATRGFSCHSLVFNLHYSLCNGNAGATYNFRKTKTKANKQIINVKADDKGEYNKRKKTEHYQSSFVRVCVCISPSLKYPPRCTLANLLSFGIIIHLAL